MLVFTLGFLAGVIATAVVFHISNDDWPGV
jgi:hypothetical protein